MIKKYLHLVLKDAEGEDIISIRSSDVKGSLNFEFGTVKLSIPTEEFILAIEEARRFQETELFQENEKLKENV